MFEYTGNRYVSGVYCLWVDVVQIYFIIYLISLARNKGPYVTWALKAWCLNPESSPEIPIYGDWEPDSTYLEIRLPKKSNNYS